jgi:hypothetical protein
MPIAYAIAAVVIASLGWDFGRRYLTYRASLLIETDRMVQLEKAFAEHKETHSKAIKNLVDEMREEIGSVKTKSSLALERASAQRKRFGAQ